MIGESFLDYFHFDSKFFKTIFPLIFKPGQLTIEYMRGKRKTHVEPFRLFLVISIIYFLLLPLGNNLKYDTDQEKNVKSTTTGQDTPGGNKVKITLRGIPVTKLGEDSIKRQIDTIGIEKYVDKYNGKENWATKLFMRQVYKIIIFSNQSFTSVLEHTTSKLIFLLIPVFALLLKLFYLKSRRLYYEHLIFSLHTHAFFFLILIGSVLIEIFIPVNTGFIILIYVIYLYLALKKYYAEKTGKTIRKFILLIILYCIIGLPLFCSLLLLISMFMV